MSMSALPTTVVLACLTLILLGRSPGGICCSDWCVASNDAPDNEIQKALDWVCLYGSACDRIQPDKACYMANDLRGVASVAFNQYWQAVKNSGKRCEQLFDVTTLVHTDPSRENCTMPCV